MEATLELSDRATWDIPKIHSSRGRLGTDRMYRGLTLGLKSVLVQIMDRFLNSVLKDIGERAEPTIDHIGPNDCAALMSWLLTLGMLGRLGRLLWDVGLDRLMLFGFFLLDLMLSARFFQFLFIHGAASIGGTGLGVPNLGDKNVHLRCE